jgi:multiple sugar transport system substrate-binding protein
MGQISSITRSPEDCRKLRGGVSGHPRSTDAAKTKMAESGVDVSAFVDEASDPNGTFLFPITDHASEALRITRAAFDSIYLNGEDAAKTLKSANEEINALFE